MAVLLILATWVVWFSATWGIGVALAPLLVSHLRGNLRARAQMGIWIGFLALVTVTVSLNFFIPMSGVFSQWIALGWIMVGIAF